MAYTSTIITVPNGFGYELHDSSGNLYVRQTLDISVTNAVQPFATSDAATTAANAAIAAAPTATSTPAT